MFDVVPLRLIPTILVGVIVYFMVGLSNDAARFFKFLLILVEFSLVMTLFVSIVAAQRAACADECRTLSLLVCLDTAEWLFFSARCVTSSS